MFALLSLLFEAVLQAFQELWNNKLRAFLSVLGISIGIFCVISVQMMVDSVERNIKQSFQKLGDDILFIDRQPWTEDPEMNWWKYLKRPVVSYDDYKAIEREVRTADKVAIRLILMRQEIKYRDLSIDNAFMAAPTHDFPEILDLETAEGRVFSVAESQMGSAVTIVGYKIAEELFGQPEAALNKEVRIMGRRMKVIGVLKKEGKSLLGDGFDEIAFVPYNYMRRYVDASSPSFMPIIVVKAMPGVSLDRLQDDVTGVLRAQRKLKPRETENFAINRISLLTGLIDSVFMVIDLAGWLIGIFSILVGGFGIANIMFVSVKERTGMIGIKKSLGAKSYFIMFEFLSEAIFLCLIGGILGLLSVFLLSIVGNYYIESFDLVLSQQNIIVGFALSFIIGIVAGFIPALNAAAMNPVEAIRQNF
jgi:putative ABC transport system permease protein